MQISSSDRSSDRKGPLHILGGNHSAPCGYWFISFDHCPPSRAGMGDLLPNCCARYCEMRDILRAPQRDQSAMPLRALACGSIKATPRPTLDLVERQALEQGGFAHATCSVEYNVPHHRSRSKLVCLSADAVLAVHTPTSARSQSFGPLASRARVFTRR